VHVTVRVRENVYNLRSKRCLTALRDAFAGGEERFGFRLVMYSVQGKHIHLLVEANDRESLSRGMQARTIRMSRALNRVMKRKGKVFADRFHAHILQTVAEVRNAVNYLRHNHRKHVPNVPPDYQDPFVSVLLPPNTWLLQRQIGQSPYPPSDS